MIEQICLAGAVSALCGLDRTAFLQLMLSRPIVAASLAGVVLGNAGIGLMVGALLELLWLGRLPMGAAIPPDDTQIAVGSTFLATLFISDLSQSSTALTLLAILVAMPLGKVGVYFDRWARKRNSRLSEQAMSYARQGIVRQIEALHLYGAAHFFISSVATFMVIVAGGWLLMSMAVPLFEPLIQKVEAWVFILFPLVGMSSVLAHLNVNRALSLFGSSFLMTYLLLWLV